MRTTAIAIVVLTVSLRAYARADANSEDVINLQRQAIIAVQAGKYDDARMFCARELKLLLARKEKAAAGAVYLDLATIDSVYGLIPQAEAKYNKGIALLKKNAPPHDPRLVRGLDGLGWLYVTWGRTAEGTSLLSQARVLADRAPLSPADRMKHIDTQAAYLTVRGRYTDAEKAWNRALEIGRAHFGKNELTYDYLLLHLGQASALCHDYETAAQMFQRYIRAEGESGGARSMSRGIAEAELAHVYVLTHKLSRSQPLFDRSLADFRTHSSEAPLLYSMVVSYLGDYYMARKDWAKAEIEYRQALQIRQKVLGNTHAAASAMLALSRALKRLHHKHEYRKLVAEATDILSAEGYRQNDTVDILSLRHQE